MNVTDEVYLKADPAKHGIIIHTVLDKGVRKLRVAWFGSTEPPSDHTEDELVVSGSTANTINGPVTGTVVQAKNVEGGVHFRGN